VLTPKSTLITGSLPSALVPDERVDYAIVSSTFGGRGGIRK
jgi:hypothetical protein